MLNTNQEASSYVEHDQKFVMILLIIVAIFWGLSNPLMKKGAHGINNITGSTILDKLFKQIRYLLRWQYSVPLIINQCGSLLYVFNLGIIDLSVLVPITNGLTFAFTAITGRILGEEKLHRNAYAGIGLIIIGSMLCCMDKITHIKS